jgi:hypothetical protein
MKQVANRGLDDFGWEIAHEAVTRRPPISLYTIVPRTEGYAYDVGVWELFIVQGPFIVAPCHTFAKITIRNFCNAVRCTRWALGSACQWRSIRTRQKVSYSASSFINVAQGGLQTWLEGRGGWLTGDTRGVVQSTLDHLHSVDGENPSRQTYSSPNRLLRRVAEDEYRAVYEEASSDRI